jgi:uncharacterized protein (TIGR03437 family)
MRTVSRLFRSSVLAILFLSASSMAQNAASLAIDTVAGGAFPPLPAQNQFLPSGGIAWDGAGNLVYCDTAHDTVRRIHPDGSVDIVAGTGITGFAGDGGPAIRAQLNQPKLPRYDSAGNLYFWDSQNFRVRRVNPRGTIASVAGNGAPYSSVQDWTGPALQRSVGSLSDMTVDAAGNLVMVEGLLVLRRLTPDGALQVLAGTGTATCMTCTNGDGGPALSATFSGLNGVVADPQGNVYVVDETNVAPGPSIRKISPDGTITTFFKATAVPGRDFTTYYLPGSLAANPKGNIYGLYSNSTIVRLNSDGTLTTLAGGISPIQSPSSPDGPALPSALTPSNLTVDAQGNIAFLDSSFVNLYLYDVAVRVVTPQSTLKTLAGGLPAAAPDGMAARNAWFLNPNSIAFDHNGNLYIAESYACKIRKVDTNGVLTTFAGTGKCAYPSPAGTAKDDISPVGSLAFDSQNRLWVADQYLNFYRINLDGTITFYPTRTPVSGTTGQIAIDNKDRVYVLGFGSLYRVLADGTTLQPVIPPPESGGRGLPSDMRGLGTDPAGNIYFGSSENVYKVNDDATFTLLYSGINGGIATGFAVDANQKVWAGNCFIYAARSGCVGAGLGYSGDGGPAQQARISGAQSLLAKDGSLYVLAGDRVRRISGLGAATAPVISANGVVNALSYTGGSLAPLEVISIFGSGFGAGGTNVPVNNSYPINLGRTKVVIGGIAAPVLAATPTQINAIVPYYLPSSSISVAVQVDDVMSAPLTVPLADTALGLATADASGSGEGAILNQDGTVNSSANPAARGSYISLFGTGAGLASPIIPAGTAVLATPYPLPQSVVTVTIGGQPATVQYAGAAPTLPNGVLQINVLVPANIPAGNAAVGVSIGGLASSQMVTVAMR